MKYVYRSVCCTLLLLPAMLLGAQSALQEAINLDHYFRYEPQNGRYYLQSAQCLADLGLYLGLQGDTITLDAILNALDGNPFIGDDVAGIKIVIATGFSSVAASRASPGGRNPGRPGMTSGLFNVTTVADGIAKFLVARVKQELSIAFFEDFQKKVQGNEQLRALFPATVLVLASIGANVYQFDQYLNDLREAFGKDMRVLPSNLATYLHHYPSILGNSPVREILAEDLLDLGQLVINHTSPDSLLAFLANDAAMQQPYRLDVLTPAERNTVMNLGAGFKTLELCSESLRSKEENQIWLPHTVVGNALRDGASRYLYLGLLWQKGKHIRFGNGKTFREALSNLVQFDSLGDYLIDFVRYGEQMVDGQRSNFDYRTSNNLNSGTLPYQPFYTFTNGLLGMLQAGIRLKTGFQNTIGLDTSQDLRLIRTLRHLDDLHYDVRQGLYISALNDLVLTFGALLDSSQYTIIKGPLIKYGRFIATMAEADNSDEVAAAIEAVALPPGSARLKKETRFSVVLNAYAGPGFGQEKLDKTGKKAAVLALSAPVGISFNTGFWRNNKRWRQSLGLFIPVIDVGALVAYRFNDPESEELPEISWKNLFSSGVYVVYGLPGRLPVALGLGAQRGPGLRKINATAFPDIKTDSGWRYGGFISVDIPVFNLFSR